MYSSIVNKEYLPLRDPSSKTCRSFRRIWGIFASWRNPRIPSNPMNTALNANERRT